jgi:hypothetical protein
MALPTHATTYAGVGLQILEKAGVRDLVEFFPEESHVVLPPLLGEGRHIAATTRAVSPPGAIEVDRSRKPLELDGSHIRKLERSIGHRLDDGVGHEDLAGRRV